MQQHAHDHLMHHAVLAGDFNFVTRHEDRLNVQNMELSGKTNQHETEEPVPTPRSLPIPLHA